MQRFFMSFSELRMYSGFSPENSSGQDLFIEAIYALREDQFLFYHKLTVMHFVLSGFD